jgi:hypothetical protein
MANLFNGSGVPTPGPALDLTGTLTYAPGSSQFIGPVTSGNGLSGNANGRFYGPAAQEIGGVYSLTGIDPLMRMLGAFGGRRP